MARYLGVDYGSRRVGLAVSDPLGMFATAHKVIECVHSDEAAARVAEAVRELEADTVVVGDPVNMDGSRGPASEGAHAFKQKLEDRVDVPVMLWDERLTTKSAHDVLIEAGTRGEKRKHLVDKVAAQILLQHYLDAHS